MTDWRRGRPGLFRRLWFSLAPDVVGLLVSQGEVSVAALDAFARWSTSGAQAEAAEVHRLEHEADAARRQLLTVLRGSLATPISQEDVYVLSERCDRVVNDAKNITSEADVLAWAPDGHAAAMAGHLHAGVCRLVDGFRTLGSDPDRTGEAATAAVRQARAAERAYRRAMAELAGQQDVRTVFTGREFYRAYARCADHVVAVADRLWFAVLAGG